MDYSVPAAAATVDKTAEAMRKRHMNVEIVSSKEEALLYIKKHIPTGAAVFNGSSTTLIDIGYMELLETKNHAWRDLHAEVDGENDQMKRAQLRRKAITETDYFLASVNAITEDGLLVACDNTGSRVGAFPFAAKKLLLIVGTNKIVPTLDDAMKRVREYVFPREDGRMMKLYAAHSGFGKWVIVENERIPDRTTVVLVREALGF
jgi:hypothetical protein